MKKRLLLIISLVAVFVCLFAVSAFAATQYEYDGVYYTLYDGDNPYAEVDTRNQGGTKADVVIQETLKVGDKTYTVTTIVANAFAGTGAFGANQSIRTLVIPKTITTLGSNAFRKCPLTSVTIKANISKLTSAEFMDCINITSIDMSESAITEIGSGTYGCFNISDIKFPPNLKTLSGGGYGAFYHCKGLTYLDLSDLPIETIGGHVFHDCSNLHTLILPKTLKCMSDSNVIQQTAIRNLVLPHGLEKLGNASLAANSSLYLMVFPEVDETVSYNASAFHNNAGKPEVVIYSGGEDTYELLTGEGKIFAGYTVLPFSKYDPNTTYTGRNFFYGATTCKECNGLLGNEGLSFNGFLNEAKYGIPCTNCGYVDSTKEIGTMFTCEGFSVPEAGGSSFSIKYRVNSKAIEAYEGIASKEIKYGLYIAIEKHLGDKDILDASKTTDDGILTAEMPANFSVLELKIGGFDTDELKAENFAIGAYVVETDLKDETTKVSYLEKEEPAEGKTNAFISFDYIVENYAKK